jgi:hypothetical protein
MQKHKTERRTRLGKFLEMVINAVFAGRSGKITSRSYLTEEEEEILRKRREERNKSELERKHDIAE